MALFQGALRSWSDSVSPERRRTASARTRYVVIFSSLPQINECTHVRIALHTYSVLSVCFRSPGNMHAVPQADRSRVKQTRTITRTCQRGNQQEQRTRQLPPPTYGPAYPFGRTLFWPCAFVRRFSLRFSLVLIAPTFFSVLLLVFPLASLSKRRGAFIRRSGTILNFMVEVRRIARMHPLAKTVLVRYSRT